MGSEAGVETKTEASEPVLPAETVGAEAVTVAPVESVSDTIKVSQSVETEAEVILETAAEPMTVSNANENESIAKPTLEATAASVPLSEIEATVISEAQKDRAKPIVDPAEVESETIAPVVDVSAESIKLETNAHINENIESTVEEVKPVVNTLINENIESTVEAVKPEVNTPINENIESTVEATETKSSPAAVAGP